MSSFLLFLAVALALPAFPEATHFKRRLDHHVQHYEHLHYDLDDLMHNHYRLRRSNDGPRHIRLAFTAFDRHFDLRLKPDMKHLHKDLKLRVNGRPHPKELLDSVSYIGHDVNDPSSEIHGHLAFDAFDGVIHTKNEVYHIEPSHRHLKDHLRESHSIIYRNSDVNMQPFTRPNSPCGVPNPSSLHHHPASGNLKKSPEDHNRRLHKRQSSSGVRDPNKVSCKINAVGDHFFYNQVTSSTASEQVRIVQAMSMIRNIVAFANIIFRRVDFNRNGQPDDISIVLQNIQINTTVPSNAKFADEFQDVTSLLTEFSKNDWSAYCTSYLFTKRDFEGGILGLAYVAEESSVGGICDPVSFQGSPVTYNTGVVTIINYNKLLTNVVIMLTFTHEMGHNFGSQHDPSTNATCSPEGNGYIMSARATDGSYSNNEKFSPCSIESMNKILIRGQDSISGCFRLADDNCGNFVVDEGEDCDCGASYDINSGICMDDICCNGTSCRVAEGMECSPQTTSSNQLTTCCNSSCSIIPQSSNQICLVETQCAFTSFCNGSSKFCPTPQEKSFSGTSCNNGSNYCRNGQCTGTICVLLGLDECECSQADLECHLCCRATNGTCVSTILYAQEDQSVRNLLPNRNGSYLEVGYPCQNFSGYCDFFYKCRPVNKEGALAKITNFITGSEVVQTAITYIVQYWWAAVIVGVVILVVLFAIVLLCHCILPRPEHMKKRDDRRREIRQRKQLVGQGHRGKNLRNRGGGQDLWISQTQEYRA